MPKGSKRSGRLVTGMTNFGRVGVGGETDVYDSRGRAVSGNPQGQRARAILGDNGIRRHREDYTKAASRAASSPVGTYFNVETTPSRSRTRSSPPRKR